MATNNNDMNVRTYTLEYRNTLESVFGYDVAFKTGFAPLQIIDGVKNNEHAFIVKTNNTPVTLNEYSTDANVAFGTGTSNTSRFGPRTEVIYTTTPVPYDYTLAINEGLDGFTLNETYEDALFDRLYLQSEAQVDYINSVHGKFISDTAGHTISVTTLDEDAVLKVFNDMAARQTNIKVKGRTDAFVRPDVYNLIVDHPLVSSGKGSRVDIDGNIILEFKGFDIYKEPADNFVEDDVMYFVPREVYIPFIGIEVARVLDARDYVGIEIQAAGRGGTYILEDNKKAVAKVEFPVGG